MAQAFNSGIKEVAFAYLQLLKVHVTKSTLNRDLMENPYYPSMLCLSDTFNKYNVDTAAYSVSDSEFNTLECPYVAFVDIPEIGRDFVLITKVDDNDVSFVYNRSKIETLSRKTFLGRFKKVVLVAKKSENSGEFNYRKSLKKEVLGKAKRLGLALFFALILVSLVLINTPADGGFQYISIVLLKILGISATILLLSLEIDESSGFLKKICSAGKKTNCEAIINSNAAKIMGVSWSELGFFYFAFSVVLLLVPNLSSLYKFSTVAIINGVAAPYVLFSVYYQWRVVKKWCPLCLTVQAILIAELLWSIFFFWSSNNWREQSQIANGGQIAITCATALLPVVAWYALKPLIIKARDYDSYKFSYKRIRYNPDVFKSLLEQQTKAADNWEKLGITVGNPLAQTTIIKVCNPYCSPCASMHPKLEEIIRHNNNLKLKIIFATKNDERDRGGAIVKHLLDIEAHGNSSITQKALDDWYLSAKKDYSAFAASNPLNGSLDDYNHLIEAMSAWCDASEISYTPTIFVNGYRLPDDYEVEDLKYLFQY